MHPSLQAHQTLKATAQQTKQPQQDSYCIKSNVSTAMCPCIRYVHIRGWEPSIKSCCASNMRGNKIGRTSISLRLLGAARGTRPASTQAGVGVRIFEIALRDCTFLKGANDFDMHTTGFGWQGMLFSELHGSKEQVTLYYRFCHTVGRSHPW